MMPINIPWFTNTLKNRALSYLLQHYLGHFLDEKIRLEQLSVDLFNGRGRISQIKLDTNALNEEWPFLPFRFVNGCFIMEISVTVPWSTLLSESCSLNIDGAYFICTLRRSANGGGDGAAATDENDRSLEQSITRSLMTSSMQIAEEIVAEQQQAENEKVDGVEAFAQLIDSVLRRVKISITNTCIFLTDDHMFENSSNDGEQTNNSGSSSNNGSNEFQRRANRDARRGVEFKIKHLHCEETVERKADYQPIIEHISKTITLEGVEIYVDSELICKLNGKHVFKLEVNDNRSDIQIEIGSILLAILSQQQLQRVLNMFAFGGGDAAGCAVDGRSSSGARNANTFCEKKMTSSDFARVEEQLRYDVNSVKETSGHNSSNLARQCVWTSNEQQQRRGRISGNGHGASAMSPLSADRRFIDGGDYTVDDDDDDDEDDDNRKFLPTQRNHFHGKSSAPKPQYHFSCRIKGPGLVIGVLDQREQFKPIELPLLNAKFNLITNFLAKVLPDERHLRAIALAYSIEIKDSCLALNCGDLMLSEQTSLGLKHFLSSDCEERATVTEAKYTLAIKRDQIKLSANSPINLLLDLTFAERYENYFCTFLEHRRRSCPSPNAFSPINNTELTMTFNFENLNAKILFPIPDLRDERDQTLPSAIRDEYIKLNIHQLTASTNFKVIDIQVREIFAIFGQHAESGGVRERVTDDRERTMNGQITDGDERSFSEHKFIEERIAHAIAADQELISLSIKCGPSPTFADTAAFALSRSEIEDSIYVSNSAKDELIDVFRVKRNIIKQADEDKEEIISPSDRETLEHYFDLSRSTTKLQVDFTIPIVKLIISNHNTLELLYNRLINDLILWKPNSPLNPAEKPLVNLINNIGSPFGVCENIDSVVTTASTAYFACKNPIAESIDSDSSFHSVTGSPNAQTMQNAAVVLLKVNALEFKMSDVGGGGGAGGSVVDSPLSQTITANKVLLGTVSGLKESRSTVISICGERVELSEANEIVISSNMYTKACSTVNISVDLTHESDELKRIKLALQITDSAMLRTEFDTFQRFIEFVKVKDELILGYLPPSILHELHIDLCNSAISLEKYYPSRPSLIAFDEIYVTSMVVENTAQTILRFIIEEASLYMKRNTKLENVLENYICLIDSGLIDLNLKFSFSSASSSSSTPSSPRAVSPTNSISDAAANDEMELRLSNNSLNIRCCVDSLHELCELFKAIAFTSTAGSSAANGNCDSDGSSLSSNSNEVLNNVNNNNSNLVNNNNNSYDKNKVCQELLNTDEDLIQDAINELNLNQRSRDEESPARNCECNLDSSSGESGFWMLGDDDVGAGLKMTDEPAIRVLTTEPIKVHEHHFGVTVSKCIPERVKQIITRYLIEEISLFVSIYGGKDFDEQKSTKCSTNEVDEKQQRYTNATRRGSNGEERNSRIHFLDLREPKVRFADSSNIFENIDLQPTTLNEVTAVDCALNPTSVALANNRTRGGKQRQTDVCVQVHLHKIKVLFDKFEPDYITCWRFLFMVTNFEVHDRLTASSINKMLYEHCSDSMPRRNNATMISVKATCQRNQSDLNEECELRVSMKPLRINLDQDTVTFLIDFFSQVIRNATATNTTATYNHIDEQQFELSGGSKDGASSSSSEVHSTLENREFDDECEDVSMTSVTNTTRRSSKASSNCKPPLFVRQFVFSPNVPIRLDYHGKQVDFKQGALHGLLMGLAQLNQSQLYLKRLHNKNGLLGFDRVLQYSLNEWTKDIKQHQLPSLLGGVGPMPSFIQLFQGIRDLIWMPIDQYRKDRRLMRGLQRGASSFSNSTAMAVLDLANRLVYVIQGTAQFVHDVVSPPVPGRLQYPYNRLALQNHHHHHHNHGNQPHHSHTNHTHHQNHSHPHSHQPHHQPRDFREGVINAYSGFKFGFGETVRNVNNAAMQANDVSSAIGGVIRQVPMAITRPLVDATNATSSMLTGMRNHLAPEARRDDQDKYKNI